MTVHDAIKKAVSIIAESDDYRGLTIKPVIFPYTRKTDHQEECIVVNSLGFPTDVLQVGFVNININVPDKLGLINIKRINEITIAVQGAFESYIPGEPYIDFEPDFENIFQESGFHVMNLRYKTSLLNN